jgi:hypothetical protein
MKDWNRKTGPVEERALVGGGRINGEGEGERTESICFIYLYENRIMKFVEIILSRGKAVMNNGRGDESKQVTL